ncbi:hypothetical protein PTI98_008587 [Pleurotus ostreatus]|nr:hypothetical protein PTI98_008587 [Pleurotus ostreatus]
MAGYDSSRVPLGPRDMRQGPGPIVYDRYTSFRTRSPSPDSLSRRMLPYHAATRPMNHHRDIYAGPNVYRPNVYRPDYDHYEPPPETFAVRDRSASWSSSGKPSAWNDRRTSLGAGPSRDADMLASRMAMAPSRMFEPSDSWKHTHDEPRLIPRVGGDRYRPATNDGGAYLHGRADVYRPSYDNSRSPITITILVFYLSFSGVSESIPLPCLVN